MFFLGGGVIYWKPIIVSFFVKPLIHCVKQSQITPCVMSLLSMQSVVPLFFCLIMDVSLTWIFTYAFTILNFHADHQVSGEDRQIPLLRDVFAAFPLMPINVDVKVNDDKLIQEVINVLWISPLPVYIFLSLSVGLSRPKQGGYNFN